MSAGVTLFRSKDSERRELTLEELLIRQFGSLAEAPSPDASHVHILTDKELQRLKTRSLSDVYSPLTTLPPEKVIDVKPAPEKKENEGDDEELKPPEDLVPVKKSTLRVLRKKNQAGKIRNRRKRKGNKEEKNEVEDGADACGILLSTG